MVSSNKRLRSSESSDNILSHPEGDVQEDDVAEISASEDMSSEGNSPDTEDQIAIAKHAKSKKTLKRKRRATDPSHFGATLQSLLKTDAPSALPLSLKSSLARQRNEQKKERKAKKVVQKERKEKEDKGRIRDVIGGWGAESERGLRKVAQRGVVKLFNAIQQSQAAASAAIENTKAARGTGKPTLPASMTERKSKGKTRGRSKDGLGRPVGTSVGEDAFFDMIRAGTVVSKS